ncbi:glycine-rich domain-containing protein [Citrobacter braakii]|uniref:glycine-rich domain-containing protein n=1 Tax=Citrobacter braakii TaxID=57706 RepID=UPI0039849805
MHRIDTPTAQKDKFGAGKNGFTAGNPQTGTPATDLDNDYFDMLQEELAGVVEATGVNLDKSKHNQLLTALKALMLIRAHPFADIKADGPAAIAEALSNLRLSDSAGFVGRLIGPPKIFTSSGTYTPTPGTKKILIEVQGAGGGGGGAGATSATSYSAGGNGTGGGYAMSLLDVAADKITSVPVTVGAGGLGGNGSPTGGNVGGASKFGSFITAGGGNGSLTTAQRDTAFTITGTYGGIATGGNIINRRGDGSDSVICIGGLIVIGRAGSSKFGAGGNGYANWNVSGKNGAGYGSGGTGATSNNSPDVYYSGGNGADGIVIVWELA